jgi:hypothetical protein
MLLVRKDPLQPLWLRPQFCHHATSIDEEHYLKSEPLVLGRSLFPVPHLTSYFVQLWLQIDGSSDRLELPGGGSALIAFMSCAVSRGFGASHPLIALADRLHDEHKVRMGPLTTFYELAAEDAEDLEKLELAYQEPALLAEELSKLVAAMTTDPMCQTFARRGDALAIEEQARSLEGLLQPAIAEGRRVRLVYAL